MFYISGSTYVANSNNLTCIEPTNDNPVEDLKCFKETKNDFSLSSGDVWDSLWFSFIYKSYETTCLNKYFLPMHAHVLSQVMYAQLVYIYYSSIKYYRINSVIVDRS